MNVQELLALFGTHFPALRSENCRLTSPHDEGYNCIAWAAEDTEHWWWPDPQMQSFWPPRVERSESIEAFAKAYATLGYTLRATAQLEPNLQKIAIYATPTGKPTHAARQVSDGWWASKLGMSVDIEHDLIAVEGPSYGRVALVLARPRHRDVPKSSK